MADNDEQGQARQAGLAGQAGPTEQGGQAEPPDESGDTSDVAHEGAALLSSEPASADLGGPADPGDGQAGQPAEAGVSDPATEVAADPLDGDAPLAGDVPPDGGVPLVRSAEIKAILEALIFASPEPLSLKAIGKLLDTEPKEDLEAALAALAADYDRPGGLQLVEVAGGYQIVTRPDLNEWVRRLFHERSTQKLSVQALETLAVIAYRQPVTAAEIAEIRGVNTSGVLNTLLERHLVKIVGRKPVVGRPFTYATTKEFLIRFGLNDIRDLPKVQDMVDALGLEAPILVEQTPPEDQLPLDEPEAEADDSEPGSSNGAVH